MATNTDPCPVCRNGDILKSPQGQCPKCDGVEERRFPNPERKTK